MPKTDILVWYICILKCIYIYIYTHVCIYIYIYMCIHRYIAITLCANKYGGLWELPGISSRCLWGTWPKSKPASSRTWTLGLSPWDVNFSADVWQGDRWLKFAPLKCSRHRLERMRAYASTSLILHFICLIRRCIHTWMVKKSESKAGCSLCAHLEQGQWPRQGWNRDEMWVAGSAWRSVGFRVLTLTLTGKSLAWTNFSAY